ncbi:hypothetical protein F4810DRAFT_710949 [Camillea tinctor]|nr:hypothetical protein F4810DRAFT_710949 [Camillea tinctor]
MPAHLATRDPRPPPSPPATKRKRTDSDSPVPVPSSKKPCLDVSLRLPSSLETKYDIQVQSVLSSSKMQQRVSAVLRHLSPAADGVKTRLSVLRARAPDAGKLVSIAEIAKRELAVGEGGGGGGRWYQYVALGEEKQERARDEVVEETVLGGPNKARGRSSRGDKVEEEEEEEEEDDDFEVMKTPLERAIEGKPLVRAVPVLNLFLARVSVEELKKRYGEQTNDPPTSENKRK